MNDNKTTTSQVSTTVETGIVQAGVVRLDLWKAVAIMFTAIISSAGASMWGTLRFVNSAPFQIIAIEKDITDIKEVLKDQAELFMPLDLSAERWKNNDKQHDEMMKKLDSIQIYIERLKV